MQTTTYRDAIDELIGTEGPCVSLTIPTFRTGVDRLEAPIRLKNRLNEAETLLLAEGLRPAEAQALLAKARDLLADRSFWLHQGDGLALYLAPNMMRYFWLPMEVEELTTVGHAFQIRALIPMLGLRPYYILALSQHGPRLYRAKGRHIREVDVPEMPESLEAALGPEYSEKQRQMHTAGPPNQAGSGISHGGGDRGAEAKDRVLRFVQAVDRAICQVLTDVVSPLVVVADEPALSLFVKHAHYPNVHGDSVRLNPHRLSDSELLERTRAVMEPLAARREDTERARFARMAGTGLTSDDLNALMRESEVGRVDVLFVDRYAHDWDFAAGEGHKEDLINRLEVETLRNAGTVYEVEPDEMPSKATVAGIFRY